VLNQAGHHLLEPGLRGLRKPGNHGLGNGVLVQISHAVSVGLAGLWKNIVGGRPIGKQTGANDFFMRRKKALRSAPQCRPRTEGSVTPETQRGPLD
jgi:hypothetical protein